MVKYVLLFLFLGQCLLVNAQRRIPLSEMKSYINLSTSSVDDLLFSNGYEKDDSFKDGSIGDWGLIKHYIDWTNARLSIVINKKLGLIKGVRIFEPDQLQYQRILNYLDRMFSKKISMKKFDTDKESRFADLWKENYSENKVVIFFKSEFSSLPYEIEIARDINFTSIEK